MRVNLGICLRFLMVFVVALIGEVRAEDCVWTEGSWAGGSMTSNGLAAFYTCFTDSSHTIKVSSGIINFDISRNDGWKLDTSTGNIYNTSDSNLTYEKNTAPKYGETSHIYSNSQEVTYYNKSYNSDYSLKDYVQYDYQYDANGERISTDMVWKDADENILGTGEGHKTYDENWNYSEVWIEYDADNNEVYRTINEHTQDENGNYKTVYADYEYGKEMWRGEEGRVEDANGYSSYYAEYEEGNEVHRSEEGYQEDENGYGNYSVEYNDGKETYRYEDRTDYDAFGNEIYGWKNYENGNLVQYNQELYDETTGNYVGARELHFEYDEENRMIRKEEHYYDASTGQWTMVGVWHYEYNADGSYNVYDDDGNLVKVYNADGSYSVYGANGEKIGTYNVDGSKKQGKRIYTISEATAAVKGNKNTFILKYR